MWLLRALLDGEVQPSQRLSQILFSCAACGNCVEHCVFSRFREELLDAFIAGRGELVNRGTIPSSVKETFESVNSYGNPFRRLPVERGAWSQGLNIEPYRDQEYLFYVGCAGSFDERGQQIARATTTLLGKWGVSFGILGEDEWCDGNEIRVLGESTLFEQTASRNIEAFSRAGIAKIITLSPHAYHVFKTEYPKLGGTFQVFHYSQVLAFFLVNGKPTLKYDPMKVTYHDPCYLGRHNREYQAPRTILNLIPGSTFLEMDRCRADALCCGGGGGNFLTDVLGSGPDSAARVRVREAAETGAQVLAVSCPKCAKMLDDAIKAEHLDGTLTIMDLAEIIQRVL